MSDPTTFESRLATALGRYADLAPVQVHAFALAEGIASSRRGRTFAGFRLTPLLIGLLLVIAAAAAAVVGSQLLPRHIEGVFERISPMVAPRSAHVAVVLNDGRVLLAGGGLGCCGAPDNALLSAEIFDPDRGTFDATGSLLHPTKAGALLDDGRVLMVAGVYDGDSGVPTSYAQVYDPTTGTFVDVGADPAQFQSDVVLATRLADGRVLILEDNYGVSSGSHPINSLVFDPASGRFDSTKSPSPITAPHDAVLLDAGSVLVTGCTQPCHALAALFHPDTGEFEGLAAPSFVLDHLAPLADGRVLALGKFPDSEGILAGPFAAIFDPTRKSFIEINPPNALASSAVTLRDGRVLILSAEGPNGPAPATAEIYDPATGLYSSLGPPMSRYGATLTVLADGRVLIAGGRNLETGAPISAAEFLH